ncbi:hypothetical protein [Spirosoma sp. KNUC1025]|uniref:hypothetical protein n=1 Tax=Spirosoma sp. KNUC1025 TaxID=2894082 RepID=UPI00386EFAED|nr:hypothetical protein LN737_06885 [Spirosoma sp. KNUC1025]
MKKYQPFLDDFDEQLTKNNSLTVQKALFFNIAAKKADLAQVRKTGRVGDDVLNFYGQGNRWEVQWAPNVPAPELEEIRGSINILPFENVFSNWEGVAFFKDTPADSIRRRFFVVDFFADEAAVGLVVTAEHKDQMYYSDFENDPKPLQINMDGYIQLCVAAKGTIYWPYLLFELIEGEENPVSERIKKHLPELFPDFSFDAFSTLFGKLRIR